MIHLHLNILYIIKHTTLFSLDISLLVNIAVKLKQEKLCLISLVDQTFFFSFSCNRDAFCIFIGSRDYVILELSEFILALLSTSSQSPILSLP